MEEKQTNNNKIRQISSSVAGSPAADFLSKFDSFPHSCTHKKSNYKCPRFLSPLGIFTYNNNPPPKSLIISLLFLKWKQNSRKCL